MTHPTELLVKAAEGDRQAKDDLYRLTEPELRKIALHWIFRKSAKERVRTTEVIDKAFSKLMRVDSAKWQHRGVFYKFASRNIFCVVVDLLRQSLNQPASLPDAGHSNCPPAEPRGLTHHSLLTLQQALDDLGEALSDDHRAVVELRFMGEHTLDEVAEILSITRDKAFKMTNVALAYLRERLGPSFPDFGHSPDQANGD
jgi:DNA-directed RNA polymerase specialized sigma24 family protein